MKRRIARKIAKRQEPNVRVQTWDRALARLSDAEFDELVWDPFRKYMDEHFARVRESVKPSVPGSLR